MDLAINVINEVVKNNPNYTTHEQILNHIINRIGYDDELIALLNEGIELRLPKIELESKDILHNNNHTESNINNPYSVINDSEVAKLTKEFKVRPYQLEYINQCSKLLHEDYDRCLMKSPTGSGKNLIIMSIIQKIISAEQSEPTTPLLIVCLSPRIDITKQIINPEYLAILQPFQFTPVIVHSDISYLKSSKEFLKARNEGKHIIISGTYQSINRIMEMIDQMNNTSIDFLIMDEAHYLAGQNPGDETDKDSVLNSIVFCDTRVKRRLFVTATPYEHQENGSANYGPLVNIVSVGQLIRLGYLAKLESSICRIAENKACSASGGEFTDKAKGLYDFMTLNKRCKCIVFVNSKQNGYELQELITTRGYSEFKVVTYFGEDSFQVLEDFKTYTEPIVIITCKRINMGVDVPDVDSIVFADPRLSMWDISQCIGRGLRLVGNKVCHCLLYDNEEHNHMIMNYLNYVVNECEYEIVKQDVKQNTTNKKTKRSNITSKSYNGVIDVRIDLLSEFNCELKKTDVDDDTQQNDRDGYQCKQCSNTYKHFSSLRTHIAKHHLSSDVKNTVNTEHKLKVKKAKIGRPKVNKCSLCGDKFTTCYSLARHQNGRCKNINVLSDSSLTNNTNAGKLTEARSYAKNTCVQSHRTTKNNNNCSTLLDGNNNNLSIDNHVEHHLTQNNNALYIQEVHINPMGKENLRHISDADIVRILSLGVDAVPALAKAIMELPENCNIVESDKRNRKSTIVNRNGDVEIMDTKDALTITTSNVIAYINSFYEKFKDDLSKQNQAIQRMARAHGLDSDEADESKITEDESFDAYFKKYMNQIKDDIDVNKKIIISRINKYKEHKHHERSVKWAKFMSQQP